MVTRRCDTKLTEPGTACTLLPVAGRGSEAWVPGHWEVPASAAWSQSTRQITTCILAAGPTCFKTARKLTSEGLVQQDLPGPSKDSRAARGPLWSKLGPPGGGDDGSGGHGIPAELFQILKMRLFRVLHSICQQIWTPQQWPLKRSVFIPIPKKGNARECSNWVPESLPTLQHA